MRPMNSVKQQTFLPKDHTAHNSDEIPVGVAGVQLKIQAAFLLPLPYVKPGMQSKWFDLRKHEFFKRNRPFSNIIVEPSLLGRSLNSLRPSRWQATASQQ